MNLLKVLLILNAVKYWTFEYNSLEGASRGHHFSAVLDQVYQVEIIVDQSEGVIIKLSLIE